MRRHPVQRVLAAVFAIWFTIAGLEPGAAGSCPMHRRAGAMANAPAGHDAHGAATTASDPSSGAAPTHAPGHSHLCTCPDACCCSPMPSLASARMTPVPARPRALRPPAPSRLIRAARVDFALPFATAPPQTTAV